MYLNNPNIKLPDDPDTIVWKYLDLSKFLDLLLSKKLFISRSDKFEDQYEGTFSETENFVDINLDGYPDFKLYSVMGSGSAGSFEDVYLYDPKSKTFNYSEEFSGYEMAVDKQTRVITYRGKSGYMNFVVREIHLDKKSRINYTEEFRCFDDNQNYKLEYIRQKAGKILKRKSKTVPMDGGGEEAREDIETVLFNMRD